MTCRDLPIEDLIAWLDGETGAADAARVSSHVEACADCRREAAALRASDALLAKLPNLAPRADFADRVIAAARSGGAAPRGRLWFLRPRSAAAAAAVLVGVAASLWWFSPHASGPGEILTAREEEALLADLAVISNLDALQRADAAELAELVDDLDVIDSFGRDADGG